MTLVRLRVRVRRLEMRADVVREAEPSQYIDDVGRHWQVIGRGLLVPKAMTAEQWEAEARRLANGRPNP